jgi:hypothetical protein
VKLKPHLLLLLLVIVLRGVPSVAQDPLPRSPDPNPSQRLPQDPLSDSDPAQKERRDKFEKDMEKKANQERQAQLKRDTEKLFELSTELKQYVEKTNENVLSVNVVKKAEEIEKLARSVKEKMRGN